MTSTPIRLGAALAHRYRIEREIGAGGMATVYLATDLRHQREVALKVLRAELAAVVGAERFLNEIRITAQLDHPHILTLIDSGVADGLLWYVMPFVRGESLRAKLKREVQLGVDEALLITRQIASALDFAHQRGVIHRDIKPENILLHEGEAVLTDFGIALAVKEAGGDRLTETGLSLGTPHYMSPEQAMGSKQLDARTDVYALGAVLYEMLAGEPPHTGPSAQAIVARVLTDPPKRVGTVRDTVPPSVDEALAKSLAKVPADRFPTAGAFAASLTRSDEAIAPRKPPARSRAAALVIAAVIVVAAVIAGITMMPRPRAPNEAARAEYVALTHYADAATSPALSRDGRMLAFIRGPEASTFYGKGQIYVKLLPDGEPVQLTNDDVDKMSPKFTPDGSRIGYTTYNGASWDTWVVPVLGKQPPRLLLSNAEGLTWIDAQSGQPRILFSETTGRDVQMAIVTSTESRAQHRVIYMPPETGMAHRSYLSPDGKQVLLIEMTYYSWLPCRLVPNDGSSTGRVVGPSPAQCTDAAWSPDGEWMYFTANTGSGFHIWRQRFPDGQPEQVTAGVTEEEGIEFAVDGRSFVTSIGTRQSTVWVHDARGDRQITSEGYGLLPKFSFDGKRLYYMLRAFAVGSHVSGGLWVADLESGERQRLLSDYLMQFYDLSADGKRIVFVAAGETERSPIWLAALDGSSAPRRLVDKDGLAAFFGSDGEVIFAAREGRTNAIYRIKEDGSAMRKLFEAANLVGLSPDGQWAIAWVPPNGITAYPVAGGAPTMICPACERPGSFESRPWASAVSWASDARHMYLQFGKSRYAIPLRPGQMLPRIPAAGFRTEQEVSELPGARRIADADVFFGPNPSSYAFTKVTTQRNIYRIPVP